MANAMSDCATIKSGTAIEIIAGWEAWPGATTAWDGNFDTVEMAPGAIVILVAVVNAPGYRDTLWWDILWQGKLWHIGDMEDGDWKVCE